MDKVKRILAAFGTGLVGILCLILGIQRKKIKKQEEEIKKANAVIGKQSDEFERIYKTQQEFREIDKRQKPEKISAPVSADERLNRLNGVCKRKGGGAGGNKVQRDND